MTLAKFKAWSGIISTWVSIAGAAAGAGFAGYQYLEKEQADRTKAALDYVQAFGKDSLQKARLRMEEYWNPKAQEIFSKTASEQDLYGYLNAAMREGRLENEFTLLASFYDDLRTCTCANICDAPTVRRFFARDAYNLYGVSYPYVAEQRKQLHDDAFALGLERLAKDGRQKAKFAQRYCVGLSDL
jgi:hypothetical protein